MCVDPDSAPLTFLELIAVQGKRVVLPTPLPPERCGFKEGKVVRPHQTRGRGAPAPKPCPSLRMRNNCREYKVYTTSKVIIVTIGGPVKLIHYSSPWGCSLLWYCCGGGCMSVQ